MGKSKELAELGQVVTQSGGNVGIGASVPEYALHLKGSYPYIAFEDTDSGSTSQHTITGNSDGNMYFDSVINNASGNSGFRFRHNSASITSLAIDASGRVTMPYQPAFHAMASNGNNISSGTIPYANVTFNRGGHYNSSTSRFTAPISGAYQFHASCYSHSGTGNSVSAKISVNGVMRQIGEVAEVGGNFGWDGINMSVIVALNAGDYVSVDWRAGAQLHVNANNNSFSGALIG